MQNILILILSIISFVSANALTTNRPMANFDYVSDLRSTNRFIVNDPAMKGGSGQVPLSVLADYMSTNPAPNNVRYWGAKGDGVTDDTAALQRAIDSQGAGYQTSTKAGAVNSSGIVRLSPGVYKISAPLKLSAGMFLQGSGRNNTIISNTSPTSDSIITRGGIPTENNENHAKFGVSDLTIIGQYGATAGAGISNLGDNTGDGGGLWPIIRNVDIVRHYNGIIISNTVFGTFEDCTIDRTSLGAFVSRGSCNNVTLRNVYAIGVGAYGFESQWATNANGFDIYSGANITAIGCAAEGIHGISYMLGNPTTVRSHSFNRSTFIDCTSEVFFNTGFYLQDCEGLTFINCNAAATQGTNCMTIAGGTGITLQNFGGGLQKGLTILMTNGTAGTMPTYITKVGNGWVNTMYPQTYSNPELFNLTPTYGATININSNFNHYQNLVSYNSTITETGTKKITMPSYAWPKRMSVIIRGFNLSTPTGAWTVQAGYYLSSSTPTITNPSVAIFGNAPFSTVRFGIENGKCVILLGTTTTSWAYVTLGVSDLFYDGNQVAGWDSGWTITNTADESGISGIVTADTLSAHATLIGTAAPTSTPSKIGNVYIDTANSKVYISKGNSSSSDWLLLN